VKSKKSGVSVPHHQLQRLGVAAALEEIAIKYGARLEDVFGSSHKQHDVAARRESMSFLRDRFNWSYPTLGEFFGRDHTSVISAVEKFKEKTKT
jgi:chromosomal replication initiator protein